MEEKIEVKLHGMWASSFCTRVELALKLKGVAYELVEEDLTKKSEALLRHNPVHKKVPVLVHGGRPVAESLAILEYVEETWEEPPLLPKDPYKRAKVRFWIDYFNEKLNPSSFEFMHDIGHILTSEGGAQEKAIGQFVEHLKILEDGIQEDLSGHGPFTNGTTPGLLDVVIGSSLVWHRVTEELVGAKLWDEGRNPLICAWRAAFLGHRVVKDTLPQLGRLLEYAQKKRERAFLSKGAPS